MAKASLPSVEKSYRVVAESESVVAATSGGIPAVGAVYDGGYVSRKVDVKLTRAQSVVLRDKLRKLQDSGARTADGRFVTNSAQTVRWIIENEVVR